MINGKSIVAIIPARGGSKGISRKNLRCIHGESLLEIAIKTAQASHYIDRVIVSSENDEIIYAAKRAGAEVPFIRPVELAQDETPGMAPVLHALQEIEPCDYTVLLQVTSPLRTKDDIDRCIEQCHYQNVPACVSVTEPRHHPHWMYTIGDKTLIPLFPEVKASRRQDLSPIYVLNGAIYIAKTDWLLNTKTFVTQETAAFVMPMERSIDVDDEFDFFLIDAYAKYKQKHTLTLCSTM